MSINVFDQQNKSFTCTNLKKYIGTILEKHIKVIKIIPNRNFHLIIADKFNEYLIQIGPTLGVEIDTTNKLPFDSYLNYPTLSLFQFNYISPTDVENNHL